MRTIKVGSPIDGFTVEPAGEGMVALVFSNRYGEADKFVVSLVDAEAIGAALIAVASGNC
jgi:hypothetical protein